MWRLVRYVTLSPWTFLYQMSNATLNSMVDRSCLHVHRSLRYQTKTWYSTREPAYSTNSLTSALHWYVAINKGSRKISHGSLTTRIQHDPGRSIPRKTILLGSCPQKRMFSFFETLPWTGWITASSYKRSPFLTIRALLKMGMVYSASLTKEYSPATTRSSPLYETPLLTPSLGPPT